MDICDINSYDELVRVESEFAKGDPLRDLLRRSHLIRHQGKICCMHRRMVERSLQSEPLFGKCWRCQKCRKIERFLWSSFFGGSKVHPLAILKLAYAYIVLGLNQSAISSLMHDAPSRVVTIEWLKRLRNVMSREVLHEVQDASLGGPGKIIVVDEMTLGSSNRKHLGGPSIQQEQRVVLGIYDVENKQGYVELIQSYSHGETPQKMQDQSHESLLKILARVEEGSVIHTNKYETYASLASQAYTHSTVNLSELFRAPDALHSNHIKAYFSKIKMFLRKRNVLKMSYISAYLGEFMWMEKHKETKWKDFIAALQRQHQVF